MYFAFVVLTMSRSHIHGELPSTMRKLTNLRCVYFRLSVPFAVLFAFLTYITSHGNLRGPIPAWFNELTLLQKLLLRHNEFSGDIPNLSNLTNLEDMWIDTQSGDGDKVTCYISLQALKWFSPFAAFNRNH